MSERSLDADVEQIAHDIENYLAEHPGAADTAAGIARWWLTGSTAEPLLPQIEAALQLLVQRGVVRRDSLPDGNCVYGRAGR